MKPDKSHRTARPCPICGLPSTRADLPFCSRCCADIDLQRWLAGAYAIPARSDAQEDDASSPAQKDEPEDK